MSSTIVITFFLMFMYDSGLIEKIPFLKKIAKFLIDLCHAGEKDESIAGLRYHVRNDNTRVTGHTGEISTTDEVVNKRGPKSTHFRR